MYPLCGLPTSLVFQHPLGVTLNDDVDVYCAVISQKQQLVNCMDCIKLVRYIVHVDYYNYFDLQR